MTSPLVLFPGFWHEICNGYGKQRIPEREKGALT